MTGNSTGKNSLIVQPRDLRFLRKLSMLRIVDREQAKLVAGFHSTTRANTRLLALTRAGLLRRCFLGSGGGRKALYILSAKGAQLAGVPCRGPRRRNDETLAADYFIQHQLTINDLYCSLEHTTPPGVIFRRWLAFYQPVAPGLSLIPDGYVEFVTPLDIDAAFLEVDLGHESLSVWKEKVRHYLQFATSGECTRQFGQERFRVLVVVNSKRRLESIRKTVAASTQKIFRFATLDSVCGDRIFGPIWLPPTGNELKTLFNETQ